MSAIPTYSELRTIRRRNASVLAQKALDLVSQSASANGGQGLPPEVLSFYDSSKPLPPPSLARRFMYRSPSLVLAGASLLQLACLFLFVIPHASEYLKDNQLYEAFVLPWANRFLLGSQYVVYFGGVIVLAQIAMLVFMLRSGDDDARPSALQWVGVLASIVEAGLAFRFSDKPEFAAACALLISLMALWDEILRQRLFRGVEMEAATTAVLSSKEKAVTLEAQVEQLRILVKIEKENNERMEGLVRAAKEEADTMQEALMVAASEMDRFQNAARERFGDTAVLSLLNGASYLGEGVFPPRGAPLGANHNAISSGNSGAGGGAGGAGASGRQRRSSRDGDFPEEEEEEGSAAEQMEAEGEEAAVSASSSSSSSALVLAAAPTRTGVTSRLPAASSAASAPASASTPAAGTGLVTLATSPTSAAAAAPAGPSVALTPAERALAALDAGMLGAGTGSGSGSGKPPRGGPGSVASSSVSSRTGASKFSQRSSNGQRRAASTRVVIKPDGSSYLVVTEEER